MVKEHDNDPIGRPGFIAKAVRRPSQVSPPIKVQV